MKTRNTSARVLYICYLILVLMPVPIILREGQNLLGDLIFLNMHAWLFVPGFARISNFGNLGQCGSPPPPR
jgi:hypothetical protein